MNKTILTHKYTISDESKEFGFDIIGKIREMRNNGNAALADIFLESIKMTDQRKKLDEDRNQKRIERQKGIKNVKNYIEQMKVLRHERTYIETVMKELGLDEQKNYLNKFYTSSDTIGDKSSEE